MFYGPIRILRMLEYTKCSGRYPHQMCPLHMPLSNVVRPHPLSLYHLKLARVLGLCATSKLMGDGLPLNARGCLLLGLSLVLTLETFLELPSNPNHRHVEVMVVCSFYSPSLTLYPKGNSFLIHFCSLM